MRAKRWMIACVAAAVALGANAELTHRFLNGIAPGLTVDSTYTEAPQFVSDIPAGTISNAPSQSMEVGMDYPNKKSGSALGNLLSSSAGSVSVWAKADTLLGDNFFMNTSAFKLMYSGPNLKAVYNGWLELALTPGSAGVWYHVALTWDDSTSKMSFYVNGSLVGSANDAVLSPMSDWGITVGGLNFADDTVQIGNQFDGKLYDLQLYDHTLDSTEVSSLYANRGSPELQVSEAVLANRYAFEGNGDDAVGGVHGSLTAAGTHIEAPLFTNDVPTGAVAGAPAQSMMVGMDYGNKKSGMSLSNTVLNSITNAGSMSVWLKPHTTVAGQYILAGGLVVLVEATDNVSVYHYPGGVQERVGLGWGVTNGGWHHVAVTWDAAEAETLIYVNGAPAIQEYDGVPGVGSIYGLNVGGYQMGDDPNILAAQFDGQLYDLQFYDDALLASDVATLHANPGSAYYNEVPAFPKLAQLTGPELISNGDFTSLTNFVLNPDGSDSDLWYETSSFGDLWVWSEGNADLVDWSFYYADPFFITPLVGTPNADDSASPEFYPLDNTTLLDTWLNGSEIILTSAQSYRNGLKSENILSGATINPGATYLFQVNAYEGDMPGNGTFTAALTSGADATNTANAIAGTLLETPAADLDVADPFTAEVSGAALAGQVNVIFDLMNTNEIPGVSTADYPLIEANKQNSAVGSKVHIAGVSLAELFVAELGDLNRDGAVTPLDVDVANSYLDGSVDNGPDAVTRQTVLTDDGLTPAEALVALNLEDFDIDGDDDFDADDVALLETMTVPVIESGAMNGSGHFEVVVSSLAVGDDYYLMRTTELSSPFDVQVDSVTAASDTETLTDTSPPAGEAFYKVSK